ncbi:YjbF family lipoprotein [Atlantibacter subterraneus]|uniref:YjbF family lipoprotein n=1 Tax=Atlantibacter subterraneus TaxID=255519 RepID=UPI002897E451|nr:YjbF family lipoprotein [Atlantibacter subterranea]
MKRVAIITVCLLLQACSANLTGMGKALWNNMAGRDGVTLTDDEIHNMPYASQYMTLNHGPQLFVVLAFSEDGQQKWVTQDQAVLITQHGRVIKTTGLGDNLLQVGNLDADPLKAPGQIRNGEGWTRVMGWTEHQQVRYATARSQFRWQSSDSLKTGSDITAVRVLEETVTTDRASWTNRYWIDSDGQIRRSEQTLGADYYPVTTQLIKAAKS